MTNESTQRCKCKVVPPGPYGGFHVHNCGRPAKGALEDGTPACGLHLGVEKRQKISTQKRDACWNERDKFWEDTKNFCEKHNLIFQGCDYNKKTVTITWDSLQKVFGKREKNEDK